MLIETHKEDERGNVYTVKRAETIHWRGRTLRISEGFESDGASVPRFFWRLVFPPLDEKALRAGTAHDFVYRTPGHLGFTRAGADEMFLGLMIGDGVAPWRAKLAYRGVRWFGGASWVK